MKGKRCIAVLIVSVLVFTIFLFTYRGTRANSTFTVLNGQEDRVVAQNAIVNSAYAFYYRGANLQYNNHSVYFTGRTQFSSRYDLVPEDINSQNIYYDVCGHFIENLYAASFTLENGTPYYVSQPLPGSQISVEESSIQMHSNAAMYNEARNMLTESTPVGSINEENEYYEIVNNSNSDVGIYYYLNKNYKDKIEAGENLLQDERSNYFLGYETANHIRNQLQEILQIGDVVIYSYTKKSSTDKLSLAGHVVVCVSVDDQGHCNRFMHSYGSDYNFTNKSGAFEANGAIKYTKACYNSDCSDNTRQYGGILDYCDNESITCKWQALRSDTFQIAVIRPINYVLSTGTYGLSDTALVRSEMPGLVRTKTASVNKHESVNPGDTITYTITLENKSAGQYEGISITDMIPANTKYVSCEGNCTENNGNISFTNITLLADETKEYSYTVKVNNNVTLGTEIISDQTMVAGIKMNTIKTLVNKTLTNVMQTKLINEVNNRISDINYHPNYTRYFIQDVYQAIVNCDDNCDDIGFNFKNSSSTSNNILNMFYNVSNNVYTLKNEFTSNRFTKMYVKNLFGGYHVSDGNNSDYEVTDGREIYFDNDSLMVGDVLVLYDSNYENEIDTIQVSGEKDMYLYLGNGKFATVSQANGNRVVTIIDKKATDADRAEVSRLLESLLGQDAFVILRPSFALKNDIVTNNGDINSDGVVDKKDAIILVRYIINGTSQYSNEEILIGDINNDGKVKMNDVMQILMNT